MRRSALAVAALGLLAMGAAPASPQSATAVVADPAAGETLFQDRCVTCHAPAGGGQGPSLKGVFDRKAAALPGFAYTAGLKGSGLVWNAPTLERFLTDPRKLVPGTAMAIRVPDPRQRRDLIGYLATRK
ncbi:MAG: c-type cytochrome [Caulobacteraceae bacterium]